MVSTIPDALLILKGPPLSMFKCWAVGGRGDLTSLPHPLPTPTEIEALAVHMIASYGSYYSIPLL